MTISSQHFSYNNRFILHQVPLVTRVWHIICALMFLFFASFTAHVDEAGIAIQIGLPIAACIYGVLIFFSSFKTYIAVDFDRKKVIIREYPGFKKRELQLYNLQEIRFSDGATKAKKREFTIDFVYPTYTIPISSWGGLQPGARLVFFNAYSRQKKRIERFATIVNPLLKSE